MEKTSQGSRWGADPTLHVEQVTDRLVPPEQQARASPCPAALPWPFFQLDPLAGTFGVFISMPVAGWLLPSSWSCLNRRSQETSNVPQTLLGLTATH